MIIGYDAKRAATNFTGLGNYSRYVIDTMAQSCPQYYYHLYIPDTCNEAAYNRLLLRNNVLSILPDTVVGASYKSLWRSWLIKEQLVRDRVNLFHGLSNEIPVGLKNTHVASVVTIHDLIFLRYPSFYKLIDRSIYNAKFAYACRNADRIVAVSQCTKRDIVEFYHIDPDKIDVIYQGCDPIFARNVAESEMLRVRMAYELPDDFILNVGTIETRKNVLLAVKALPMIDEKYHLVIVGRKTSYISEIYKFIKENRLGNRVHFIHDMALSDLPVIYRMSKAFVFPSRYEGFGIPIIEALTSGVPVVAATGSCLEEAGGPASLYVSPDDVEGMAKALQKILSDSSLRAEMINYGREYVSRFDSSLMASALLETYGRVMEMKKRRKSNI